MAKICMKAETSLPDVPQFELSLLVSFLSSYICELVCVTFVGVRNVAIHAIVKTFLRHDVEFELYTGLSTLLPKVKCPCFSIMEY